MGEKTGRLTCFTSAGMLQISPFYPQNVDFFYLFFFKKKENLREKYVTTVSSARKSSPFPPLLLASSWSIYAEFSLRGAQRQRQTQPLIRCSPRQARRSNHGQQEVRGGCFQNKSAALPSIGVTFQSLALKTIIGM